MKYHYPAIFCLLAIIVLSCNNKLNQTDQIRLNQIGFFPKAEKIAAVINTSGNSFQIKSTESNQTVFSGKLSTAENWEASGEEVKIADFSGFRDSGEFVLVVPGLGKSFPFSIGNNVFKDLSKGVIKAFYFNRASTALEEKYAGKYKRPFSHPDTAVIVHASAASENRPAGTKISTPKGWYDAGDLNKYIVNSGISVFTLLSAYENFPAYYENLELNIPEYSNDLPDILDEALWNIQWMTTMQDPHNGGVYHKNTHAGFQGQIMPHEATAPRYVVAKGTAATLDFTAIMAITARVYKPYRPDFAEKCLQKAKKAWQWAQENPDKPFNNPPASNGYPEVTTGEYGDDNFSDEFSWAASELYITTGNDDYYDDIQLNEINYGVPSWPDVETLGLISLLTHKNSLTTAADTSLIKNKFYNLTREITGYRKNNSPYRIPINNFFWGSNSLAANQGMLMALAYKNSGQKDYFNGALSALDYLLGRNATNYCFVTGYGDHSPMNIHHRQSAADGIEAPIPGFLAGGPNPGNTDQDCGSDEYPSLKPAKAYLDDWCSFSTNEICINWNAPLVFLSGAIQYEYKEQINK